MGVFRVELLQELAYQKALQRARGEKAFVLQTNAELKHAVCWHQGLSLGQNSWEVHDDVSKLRKVQKSMEMKKKKGQAWRHTKDSL